MPDLRTALPYVFAPSGIGGGSAVTGQGPKNAIRFPSNGESPASVYCAIEKLNCASDGMGMWGGTGNGWTVITRRRFRSQAGFHAGYWLSPSQGDANDTQFDANHNVGFHPYPNPPPRISATTTNWEIAAEGQDYLNNRNSSAVWVTYDQWFTQAIRVIVNGNTTKTLIFYLNLPSTSNDDVIEVTTAAGYADSSIPGGYPYGALAVTIGDSPWWATNQQERFSGSQAEIKIFSEPLSEADTLSEAANLSQLVTAAGQASIWWGKNNFDSIDDLTCDYGTGRTLVWANASYKGTLEQV